MTRTSLDLSKKLYENWCRLESDKTEYIDFEWMVCMVHTYDILNDICVKYAKEFFGEDNKRITAHILDLIQDKDKSVESEIRDACLFNKENKDDTKKNL